MYRIERLRAEELGMIDDLLEHSDSGKDYKINYKCEFIAAKNETKLGGIAGYLIGKRYPQFKHIILRKGVYPILAAKLIQKMEKVLKKEGYNDYVGFISNKNNFLQSIAIRLGYKAYANNDKGVWFYRRLK